MTTRSGGFFITSEPPISSATLATTCATPHSERMGKQNNRQHRDEDTLICGDTCRGGRNGEHQSTEVDMTEKYEVTATKKDGTTYHGLTTMKEPRITNGLIGISGLDGSWTYTAPDEISDIRYIPVVEEKSKE